MSAILLYARAAPGPFHRAMRYDRIAMAMLRAHLFGTGFASDVPGGIVAFLKSDPSLAVPDIQLLFTAAPLGAGPWLRPFVEPFRDGFACRVVMLHPESRGRVELASADPLAPARIRANLLATDRDRAVLRRGLALARDVASQAALRPFFRAETAPGPAAADASALDALCPGHRHHGPPPAGDLPGTATTPAAWSIRSFACAASRPCASSMRRSCRGCPAATSTPPSWRWPSARAI